MLRFIALFAFAILSCAIVQAATTTQPTSTMPTTHPTTQPTSGPTTQPAIEPGAEVIRRMMTILNKVAVANGDNTVEKKKALAEADAAVKDKHNGALVSFTFTLENVSNGYGIYDVSLQPVEMYGYTWGVGGRVKEIPGKALTMMKPGTVIHVTGKIASISIERIYSPYRLHLGVSGQFTIGDTLTTVKDVVFTVSQGGQVKTPVKPGKGGK